MVAQWTDILKAAPTPEEKTAVESFKEHVRELAETGPGSRNEVLNKTAFYAGTLVSEGHMSSDWAMEQLLQACEENEYGSDAERVAKTALEAGLRDQIESKRSKNPIYKRLITSKGLKNLPPAKWTIEGALLENSIAVLYGQPETGKSFLTIDLVGCLANKNQWQGRAIHSNRPCVYIAAEGTTGLPDRVAAWEEYNQMDMRDVSFYPRPIQVGDKEWDYFIEYAEDTKPGLTVIDTYAQTSAIVDEENSSTQANKYIRQLNRLKMATQGSVLVIHHTGRAGVTMRGSNALDGAADSIIKSEDGERYGTLDVFITKLKEGVKSGIGTFRFKSVKSSAVLEYLGKVSWER